MAGVDGKMQYKEAPSRRWAAAAAEQLTKGTAILRVQTHVRVSGRAVRRFLCFHFLEFCPCSNVENAGPARKNGQPPGAGLIFETKNRAIFLERFFWRDFSAAALLPVQLCSH